VLEDGGAVVQGALLQLVAALPHQACSTCRCQQPEAERTDWPDMTVSTCSTIFRAASRFLPICCLSLSACPDPCMIQQQRWC
jgi:hypothetical protein